MTQTNFHPDEPEIHGTGKRKRKKTYAIEWRLTQLWPDWVTYKKYETFEDRHKAMVNLQRENSFIVEYRIVDEAEEGR